MRGIRKDLGPTLGEVNVAPPLEGVSSRAAAADAYRQREGGTQSLLAAASLPRNYNAIKAASGRQLSAPAAAASTNRKL